MYDRRRHKRLPITMTLNINKLFKQDNVFINDISEEIDVVDISKTGLGFYCVDDLPLGYYFDAKIVLENEKNYFYCVIKLVRKEAVDEGYLFGCEFVGLAEILSKKIDEYEEKIGHE